MIGVQNASRRCLGDKRLHHHHVRLLWSFRSNLIDVFCFRFGSRKELSPTNDHVHEVGGCVIRICMRRRCRSTEVRLRRYSLPRSVLLRILPLSGRI